MPRYDFRCPECQEVYELRLSYEEYDRLPEDPRACARCLTKLNAMERVLTAAPVHYKGFGWFSTDNADSLERYARDHFDGSGTNTELKQKSRVQQRPS